MRGFDDVLFGAGHDFEVYVSVELVFVADDVNDFDHPLGRFGTCAGDAGTEEQPFNGLPFD